jgi:hypothetical protein
VLQMIHYEPSIRGSGSQDDSDRGAKVRAAFKDFPASNVACSGLAELSQLVRSFLDGADWVDGLAEQALNRESSVGVEVLGRNRKPEEVRLRHLQRPRPTRDWAWL